MKARRTWVVVADGARARFLASVGPGPDLVQLPDGAIEGSRALESEIGSDRPGRSYESVGGQRHGIEPRSSLHDQAEDAFLGSVVDRLEQGRRDGAFERLVIVAAPRSLGTLRQKLSEPLAALVVATLDKDLTRAPLDQIAAEVAAAGP